MDNPVDEITPLIKTLCQAPPAERARAIAEHYVPDAAFQHPFAAVPRYGRLPPWLARANSLLDRALVPPTSRDALARVYLWYAFMSPDTVVEVDSVAFDEPNKMLYVSCRQRFTIWFVPFYAVAVSLVAVMTLEEDAPPLYSSVVNGATPPPPGRSRYRIARQEDHYQLNEFLKYLVPYAPVAAVLWGVQVLVALGCSLSLLAVQMLGLMSAKKA